MTTDYRNDANASTPSPPQPTAREELIREVLKFLMKHGARFQYANQEKKPCIKGWQLSSTPTRSVIDIEKRAGKGLPWMIALTDLVKEGGLCFFDADDEKGWEQYKKWREEALIPPPCLLVETSKTFDIKGKRERGFHAWHFLAKGHGIEAKGRCLLIQGKEMEAAGYGNLEFFGWGRYGIGPYSTIGGYKRKILHFNHKATTPLPKKMCEMLNSVPRGTGKKSTTKTSRPRGRPRKIADVPAKKENGDRHNALLTVIMHIYDPQWGLSDKTARSLIEHYDKLRHEQPLSEEDPDDVENQITGAKEIWAERTKLVTESPIVTVAKEHYPDVDTSFYQPAASPAATLEARLKICGYEVCYHLREGHAFACKVGEESLQPVGSELRSQLLDLVTAKTLPYPTITDSLKLNRDQPRKIEFGDNLTALAYNKQFDPVKEQFDTWWEEKGSDELTMEQDYQFWLKIADELFRYDTNEDKIIMSYGLKYLLLGLVWRAYEPGCEFNLMPIWCGGQGAGKSCLVAKLAMQKDWYRKGLPMHLLDKAERLAEQLSGAYLIEDQEARGVGNTDKAADYRAFLDVTNVRCRGAYKDIPGSLQLRCGYVATSNTRHVLHNETSMEGDRRLLCCWVLGKHGDQRRKNGVHICEVIDRELRNMYQRALSLFHAGVKPWLTDGETELVMRKSKQHSSVAITDEILRPKTPTTRRDLDENREMDLHNA